MNGWARIAVVVAAASVWAGCGGDGGPSGTGGGFGGSGGSGGGFGGGFGAGGGSGAGGGGSSSCGPQNCTGCCHNGACQTGSTAAGCGKNGAACSMCSSAQICRVDQTCGVDPESTWVVQPTGARIAANNNGSSWDGDGSAPDPQVFMTCADLTSSASSTPEASDTYQPSWTTGGCSAKAKDLLRAGWTFRVYDIDALSDDTLTSSLTVTITEAHFTGGGFSVAATGGLESMTVSLRKQ